MKLQITPKPLQPDHPWHGKTVAERLYLCGFKMLPIEPAPYPAVPAQMTATPTTPAAARGAPLPPPPPPPPPRPSLSTTIPSPNPHAHSSHNHTPYVLLCAPLTYDAFVKRCHRLLCRCKAQGLRPRGRQEKEVALHALAGGLGRPRCDGPGCVRKARHCPGLGACGEVGEGWPGDR